ncbi:uncharacterized protein LOC131258144 [Magnolia sinica]|uniref:uncharacterized protein LOC131258144 n=1 Tax=Magnolia sinica TaxID=86752 RepID=UPI0026598530|nr:uncharacterized protein LOC131258144 [Magnolia sinica]
MTTLENLFMQIFDRRNWILDQLKNQTHSYDQSLASNLLINGIRPPSWLWNPAHRSDAQNAADLKDLKREELISGLLFPPPRPPIPPSTGHCTIYNKQAAKEDNRQLSDSLITETCASNRCFEAEDRSTAVAKISLNGSKLGQKCNVSEVPELDTISASPHVQTDAKIDETYFDLNQSLARIQRSKSRQKALELRNSVKESSEKCLSKENITYAHTGRVTRSTGTHQQPTGVMESSKDSSGITNGCGGRVTRSRSTKQLNCVDDASIKPGGCLNCLGGDGLQKAVDADVTVPSEHAVNKLNLSSNDVDDIDDPHSCAAGSIEMEIVLDTPDAAHNNRGRLESSISRSPIDTNTIVEPRQLVFDDIEECSALEEAKQESSLEMRDVVESVPTQLSKKEPISKDFQDTDGSSAAELPSEKAVLQNKTVDCMKEALKTSIECQAERCDMLQKQESEHEFCDVSFTYIPSNLSAPSSTNRTSISNKAFCGDALTDSSAAGSGMSNRSWSKVAQSNSSPSQIVGKGSLESELRAENFDFPKVVIASHIGNSAGEKCIGEFDARPHKSLLDDCELAAAANDFPGKFTRACLNSASALLWSGGPDMLDAQEPQLYAVAADAENVVRQKITPEPAQSPRREVPYFLRSSTSCDKNLHSSKSNGGHDMLEGQEPQLYAVAVDAENGSVLRKKVTPKPAQSPRREAPYFLRSSTSCDKNLRSSKSNGGPDMLEALEPQLYAVAVDAENGSVLRQKVTPKPAQSSKRDAPYFLRSSTFCSSKSDGSHSAKPRQSVKNVNNACVISWPMFKRRKTDGQSNNFFNTSPRVREVNQPGQIHEDSIKRHSKSLEVTSERMAEVQNFSILHEVEAAWTNAAIHSSGAEMHQRKQHLIEEVTEPSQKLQVSCPILHEDNFDLKWKDQSAVSSMAFKHAIVEASLDLGQRRQTDGDTDGCLKDIRETPGHTSVLDEQPHTAGDDLDFLYFGSKLRHGDPRLSAYTQAAIEELKSYLGEHGQVSSYSARSPCHEDPHSVVAEESMPEFEGFSVGVLQENKLSLVAGDGICSHDQNISSITKEQVGVLEQLCRSTGMLTPLHPSTRYKIHTTPDVCRSLPKGLLEHMDLGQALPFCGIDSKEHKGHEDGGLNDVCCNIDAEVDGAFLGSSYSNCMPSSSVRFGWDARPPFTPPAGKLSQRIISKSIGGSSEEKLSINPELTCFRIDEDTCINEENGYLGEGISLFQEGIDLKEGKTSNRREVIADLTSEGCNSPSLASAEKFPDRCSLDSVNTEFNSLGTQMAVKKKLENGYGKDRKSKNEDKENRDPSIVGNGARKASKFQYNRNSRPKLSGKAAEKKESQTFSEKSCKPNNIVSNVSSFIPLVQQKQAAAVLTGKRDIRVKALEAAEAAKNLAEKRANERKMRKEAANIEQKRHDNIKQMELMQKKKEEERKKKEADMAARKRQREEEERKEKERKRKCIEETRKQLREHEEKLRAEREEKELRRKTADEERKRNQEAKKQQKTEKVREQKRTEMEQRPNKVVAGDARHASNNREDRESCKEADHIGKVFNGSDNLCKANEDGGSVIEGSKELQAYEISPYQSSDDEEEEEDEITERKFIPSWARGKCLAQNLSALQHIDPTAIFLHERCFSLSEVLLPRKRKPL